MSVIVKHMEMPDCCENCELNDHIDPFCRATGVDIDDENRISCRPSWCTLVQLPEKHGDLLDRNRLIESKFKNDIGYAAFVKLVKRQVAVVKVEGEK